MSGGDADGEGVNFLHSFPNSLGAGVAIAFAAEEAAETGDEPGHLAQRWRDVWGRFPMGDDPGGPPFFRVEDHFAREVGAFPSPRDEMENPPRDDPVEDQGALQPLKRPQLQRFDPATRFQDPKEDFDQPAATIPLNQLHDRVQGVGGAVGQQPPVNGRGPLRRTVFTRQNRGDRDRRGTRSRRERDRFPVEGLAHETRGSARGGGERQFNGPQRFAAFDAELDDCGASCAIVALACSGCGWTWVGARARSWPTRWVRAMKLLSVPFGSALYRSFGERSPRLAHRPPQGLLFQTRTHKSCGAFQQHPEPIPRSLRA